MTTFDHGLSQSIAEVMIEIHEDLSIQDEIKKRILTAARECANTNRQVCQVRISADLGKIIHSFLRLTQGFVLVDDSLPPDTIEAD